MKKARRVLLKVSGEWFSGTKEKGFDEKTFASLAKSLVEAKRKNIQIALVLGGGNISVSYTHLTLPTIRGV